MLIRSKRGACCCPLVIPGPVFSLRLYALHARLILDLAKGGAKPYGNLVSAAVIYTTDDHEDAKTANVDVLLGECLHSGWACMSNALTIQRDHRLEFRLVFKGRKTKIEAEK